MPRQKLCAIPDCNKPRQGREWCSAHYRRWRVHGDPLGKAPSWSKRLKWLHEHKTYDGDDCLIWPFFRTPDGWGYMVFRGKSGKASRHMCILAHGEPPTPQHEAAHSCGNGSQGCVNPKHLRWATRLENLAEIDLHGHRVVGEDSVHAKLSEDDVRQIRSINGAMPHRAIAHLYGVTHSVVQKVINRQSWKHVE